MSKKNIKHRDFINQLPCSTCHEIPPSECSHIRRKTDCGTGLKPSDKFTIPQCKSCHGRVDFIISRDNVDIFLNLASALCDINRNLETGVKIIIEFRRRI